MNYNGGHYSLLNVAPDVHTINEDVKVNELEIDCVYSDVPIIGVPTRWATISGALSPPVNTAKMLSLVLIVFFLVYIRAKTSLVLISNSPPLCFLATYVRKDWLY